ncbi:MAG: hypothetical protein ABFR63_00965 [Thermodesulfobacteriota bacterium]
MRNPLMRRKDMKKMMMVLLCCSLLFALPAWGNEWAGQNRAQNSVQALEVETLETNNANATNAAIDSWSSRGIQDTVDIYDIFVRSLPEVDLYDEDIQFFVDRLPYGSRVFVQTSPNGPRVYTFLSETQFGCIAKILPAVPGVKPELYMHIENCQMSRHRKSGSAVTNYIRSTIHKADGTMVKAFNSTATWTFHHVDNVLLTTGSGMEYSDIWLVETLVVNTPGPSMVQYYTVEDVGIIGKRVANVSWQ